MKRKGWFIPILVFLVSIIFLLSYQQKQNVFSFADNTVLPPTLWSEASSDITRVVYESAGKTIDASRSGENWTLSTSNDRQADSLYIYQVMNPFLEPLFNEVVEVSPTHLDQYGIVEPTTRMALYDNEGNEYTLIKGSSKDTTYDYVYSPLTDTVYTMNASAFANISTSSNDWSNKQLLTFTLDEVQKIELVYKGHDAVLLPTTTQSGTIFSSNELDDRLVNEFLNFLQVSKIQDFITESASEHVLSVYGFNSPLLKCTISLQSGETLSLTIGDVNEEESFCYARVNGSTDILSIPYFNLSQFNILYSELHDEEISTLG